LSAACGPDLDALGESGAHDSSTSGFGSGAGAETGLAEASTTGAGETSGRGTSDAGAYEEDDGGTGCAYVCPQPTAGSGPTLECDVFAQDCPLGEKCMPWANDGGSAWNATRCSPLDPSPALPGEPCVAEGSGVSGTDDCAVASMCWDVDPDTLEGVCVAFCTGTAADPMCADPTTVCLTANDGVLALCLPVCDPIVQDCIDDQACYPANTDFVCVPDASGPDLGAYGDPCEYINACDPGLFCASSEVVPGCAGAVGCCSEFCDLTAADANAQCSGVVEGQECTPWYGEDQAPPLYEHVGACAVPA
jgi:hypothetical protein